MPTEPRDRTILRDYLRKVRFPGLAGPDPVKAFMREVAGVLAGGSRN
jgi:hypothetical protein